MNAREKGNVFIGLLFIVVVLGVSACASPSREEVELMNVSSPAFEHNGMIPSKYTCDGENISPEIRVSGVPEGTKSLVLVMEDPDVPARVRPDRMWDHWVVFNIPPNTSVLPEGSVPHGVQGRNTSGKVGYGGPCPPDREHRYFFYMYALDTELDLSEGVTKKEVLSAMKRHILEKSELMGRYERS